jgi:hypothetical protein
VEVGNVYGRQSNGRNRSDGSSCMLVSDVNQRDLCLLRPYVIVTGWHFLRHVLYLIVSYTALLLKLHLVVGNRSLFSDRPNSNAYFNTCNINHEGD